MKLGSFRKLTITFLHFGNRFRKKFVHFQKNEKKFLNILIFLYILVKKIPHVLDHRHGASSDRAQVVFDCYCCMEFVCYCCCGKICGTLTYTPNASEIEQKIVQYVFRKTDECHHFFRLNSSDFVTILMFFWRKREEHDNY